MKCSCFWQGNITSDAVSFQVNPLECGYFSKLIRENGESVIGQADGGQMLHFCHDIWEFGEDVTLQVQLWKIIPDSVSTTHIKGRWKIAKYMRRIGVYFAAPLRLVKVEKNLLEITFISLSARVITRMSSETLLRTLKTPSGKEMSLQFDRSVERKNIIRRWQWSVAICWSN